jgi:hypothetical protein
LATAEKNALKDQEDARSRFHKWAISKVPAAEIMNVGSGLQVRQLLFAGALNQKQTKKAKVNRLETTRVFKVRDKPYFKTGFSLTNNAPA